jgi:uncharacterized protein YjlB
LDVCASKSKCEVNAAIALFDAGNAPPSIDAADYSGDIADPTNKERNLMDSSNVLIFYFEDDGTIPNNPDLPVLFYQGVLKDKAGEAEAVFNRNNWLNSWTNGVFAYHHYHSNAHEVLGVLRGNALLQIGGESGKKVEVHAGDIIVLPAGTGHKKLGASPDFKVAGAYPNGMSCNLKTGRKEERPAVLNEIKQVPLPEQDPVYGDQGPLIMQWKK